MVPMAMATTPTLMEATEPMDTGTPMLTMVSTTARGLLRLSLRPMLRLTPTTTVPTDLATTDSATEPTDTGTDTAATGATTGDKFSVLRSTKQKLKANI